MSTIYLDYSATAPLWPSALEAMEQARRTVGNASSLHAAGRRVRRWVDDAMDSVRVSVGAPAHRPIPTGSGTEANNLGVLGLARGRRRQKGVKRILIGPNEHCSVHAAALRLQQEGFTLERLAAERGGVVAEDVEAQLGPDVALVALQLGCGSTGLLQPLESVCQAAARHAVPVHVDAAAAWGRVPIELAAWGVSSCAVSGHKLGGPRGIGVLLLDPQAPLEPLWQGGGQAFGLRSGSLAPVLAAGLGAAVEAVGDVAVWLDEQRQVGEKLRAGVRSAMLGVRADWPRLPHVLVMAPSDGSARHIAARLDERGVRVGLVEVDPACLETGASPHAEASGPVTALRFSWGWQTPAADQVRVEQELNRILADASADHDVAMKPRVREA